MRPNIKSARLDSKWTYRWTQKYLSLTEKYIIIMQVYFERKCWVMDEILEQVKSIKEQTEKAIEELNIVLDEQAQSLSDKVDILEDYTTVSNIEGFFLDYRKYLRLVKKQQVIYNGAINRFIKLYGDAYKKGKKDALDKVGEAFTEGYKAGKEKEKTKHQDFETCYIECISKQDEEIEELQHKLKELQSVQRDDRTMPPPLGKALEISGRKVEEIIKLYIREEKLSIRAISKQTGCTRNQITRIIKGQLKHQKSKEKVVHAIKRLLKVNQNPKTIEKLNELMNLYIIVNTAS